MPNVNSGIIKPSMKQEIFDTNRDLFDIIYFLGTGFMLSDHIYAYGKAIYDLSEKSITRKLINMCGKGLLLEKEATTTGTKIYVLSKYVKSKYESKPSQNVSSVKITERKLWKNFYMNEYIIQRIVRYLLKNEKEISIQGILDLLEENFITFQTTQNRQDVFALYEKFYDEFMCGSSEPFMQDFNALAADLYLFGKNFLKTEMDIDYSEQIRQRKIRQLDKDAYKNEEDKNKYFYNLYQFVMQGFFFNGFKEDVIQIGLFEIGILTFEKIYKQICYILLMLERYLGYMPKLSLTVYYSDIDAVAEIEREAKRKSYNFKTQEFSDNNKKYKTFKALGIREQYWENIEIRYIFYDLKNRYNL